ncbi:UNVERIFIED_CONTAM: hypothetical protein HDU68_002832 [Siphonaria sp. JEL0065]|nr:hypothetical protein HDU68_002832 [Siphonaria sp. JEL0065]
MADDSSLQNGVSDAKQLPDCPILQLSHRRMYYYSQNSKLPRLGDARPPPKSRWETTVVTVMENENSYIDLEESIVVAGLLDDPGGYIPFDETTLEKLLPESKTRPIPPPICTRKDISDSKLEPSIPDSAYFTSTKLDEQTTRDTAQKQNESDQSFFSEIDVTDSLAHFGTEFVSNDLINIEPPNNIACYISVAELESSSRQLLSSPRVNILKPKVTAKKASLPLQPETNTLIRPDNLNTQSLPRKHKFSSLPPSPLSPSPYLSSIDGDTQPPKKPPVPKFKTKPLSPQTIPEKSSSLDSFGKSTGLKPYLAPSMKVPQKPTSPSKSPLRPNSPVSPSPYLSSGPTDVKLPKKPPIPTFKKPSSPQRNDKNNQTSLDSFKVPSKQSFNSDPYLSQGTPAVQTKSLPRKLATPNSRAKSPASPSPYLTSTSTDAIPPPKKPPTSMFKNPSSPQAKIIEKAASVDTQANQSNSVGYLAPTVATQTRSTIKKPTSPISSVIQPKSPVSPSLYLSATSTIDTPPKKQPIPHFKKPSSPQTNIAEKRSSRDSVGTTPLRPSVETPQARSHNRKSSSSSTTSQLASKSPVSPSPYLSSTTVDASQLPKKPPIPLFKKVIAKVPTTVENQSLIISTPYFTPSSTAESSTAPSPQSASPKTSRKPPPKPETHLVAPMTPNSSSLSSSSVATPKKQRKYVRISMSTTSSANSSPKLGRKQTGKIPPSRTDPDAQQKRFNRVVKRLLVVPITQRPVGRGGKGTIRQRTRTSSNATSEASVNDSMSAASDISGLSSVLPPPHDPGEISNNQLRPQSSEVVFNSPLESSVELKQPGLPELSEKVMFLEAQTNDTPQSIAPNTVQQDFKPVSKINVIEKPMELTNFANEVASSDQKDQLEPIGKSVTLEGVNSSVSPVLEPTVSNDNVTPLEVFEMPYPQGIEKIVEEPEPNSPALIKKDSQKDSIKLESKTTISSVLSSTDNPVMRSETLVERLDSTKSVTMRNISIPKEGDTGVEAPLSSLKFDDTRMLSDDDDAPPIPLKAAWIETEEIVDNNAKNLIFDDLEKLNSIKYTGKLTKEPTEKEVCNTPEQVDVAIIPPSNESSSSISDQMKLKTQLRSKPSPQRYGPPENLAENLSAALRDFDIESQSDNNLTKPPPQASLSLPLQPPEARTIASSPPSTSASPNPPAAQKRRLSQPLIAAVITNIREGMERAASLNPSDPNSGIMKSIMDKAAKERSVADSGGSKALTSQRRKLDGKAPGSGSLNSLIGSPKSVSTQSSVSRSRSRSQYSIVGPLPDLFRRPSNGGHIQPPNRANTAPRIIGGGGGNGSRRGSLTNTPSSLIPSPRMDSSTMEEETVTTLLSFGQPQPNNNITRRMSTHRVKKTLNTAFSGDFGSGGSGSDSVAAGDLNYTYSNQSKIPTPVRKLSMRKSTLPQQQPSLTEFRLQSLKMLVKHPGVGVGGGSKIPVARNSATLPAGLGTLKQQASIKSPTGTIMKRLKSLNTHLIRRGSRTGSSTSSASSDSSSSSSSSSQSGPTVSLFPRRASFAIQDAVPFSAKSMPSRRGSEMVTNFSNSSGSKLQTHSGVIHGGVVASTVGESIYLSHDKVGSGSGTRHGRSPSGNGRETQFSIRPTVNTHSLSPTATISNTASPQARQLGALKYVGGTGHRGSDSSSLNMVMNISHGNSGGEGISEAEQEQEAKLLAKAGKVTERKSSFDWFTRRVGAKK